MQGQETPDGRALREHRAGHQECDRHCKEYLAIARSFTEKRVIREGPVAPYSWISIREAS